MLSDCRYALRNLRKDRRFSFVAILTLSLGIGSSTVIFSLIDCVLLRPFPYQNVSRLATFHIHFPGSSSGDDRYLFAAPELLAFQQQNHVFEDLIGLAGANILYAGTDGPQRWGGGLITPNAFAILGVKPLIGRPIGVGDGEPSSPPVFVMSYSLWVRQFNRNPKILGTTFILNGEPKTLVAVMPPRFHFGGSYEIWVPTTLTGNASAQSFERGPWFWPIGVLKSSASIKGATTDLNLIARSISKIYPAGYLKEFGVSAESLTQYFVGDVRNLLLTLAAAVILLLLIACINVANLLLLRSTARAKEIAIRASIGASRTQLIRQLVIESLLLGIAGCTVGSWIAYFGLNAVVTFVPSGTFPSEVAIRLSPEALFFALIITLLCTLLAGLSPLVHTLGGDLRLRLTSSGRGTDTDISAGRLRSILVIGEVALSIVALAGTGLMARTMIALQRVDVGIDPSNVLTLRLHHSKSYDSPVQKNTFYRRILDRLESIPGISSAAESISAPPYSNGLTDVAVSGKAAVRASNAVSELCSENYFSLLKIPLLAGRAFSKADVDSARQIVVVNRAFAHSIFPAENPIGRKIKFPVWDANYADWPHGVYFEIIGVVGDTKNKGLREPTMPQVFLPYTITATGLADDRVIMLKSIGNAEVILPTIQHVIHELDPGVAITDIDTIEEFLREDSAQPRLGLTIIAVFAAVGLSFVAIGIFSVMAYTVSLRMHEIGVRVALGAQQNQISRMVLSKGFKLIGAGIFIGLSASFALTRFITSQIWGVSATDPWTYCAVSAVIIVVGFAACAIPARRAAAVDPLVALHYE
jgi:predicted permease